jgi:phospholipid/cholesterol/gamma-HCH transport system substrate-binding protein
VLQADRAGNQLTTGADVKARGVIVGAVRDIRATDDGAELTLALEPGMVDQLPSDAAAQLLPKTLFGEKYVALVFDEGLQRAAAAEGDVIAQDRSATGREFSEALDSLLPLLQTLEPQQVSTTLNALSTALRGRGEQIGDNLVLVRQYLQEFNPELPVLEEDFRGIADFADNLDASADDFLTVLRNLSEVNRDLVDQEGELDAFLRARPVQRHARGVRRRERAALRHAGPRERPEPEPLRGVQPAVPVPGQRAGRVRRCSSATRSGACSRAAHHPRGHRRQGRLRAGRRARVPRARAGADLPRPGGRARGARSPSTPTAQDGYRDGQPVEERTGKRGGPPPAGPEGPYTYRDQRRQGPDGAPGGEDRRSVQGSATPFSPASYDKAAVGLAVAPAYGVQPDEVPDVAVLLFGPVARDTVVTPA